ncbi:MAG: AAA family ATPase, partial [Dehalococcoidia bacterium]|nr:AAA family ATPase [Dehalococcoidia bacterium]
MKTADEQTLHRIVNDLFTNLIVEAGAGTGKTYALVSRVVALVKSGARMRDIVAITFTEAAAAELSERVRSRLEQILDENNTQNDQDPLAATLTGEDRERLERAVSELDEASMQTIHSFAAQLLRERPLDAGLPPGWMNLDEITDSERLNERWDEWIETTLAQDADISTELAASLRYLAETEGDIGKWKAVTQAICEDLHRLPGGGVVVEESGLGSVVEKALETLSELAGECSN